MFAFLAGIAFGCAGGGAIALLFAGATPAPENPRSNVEGVLLATLRNNLMLLEEELKNRRFCGVRDYIEPVERAVERTKSAIAFAEDWP